MTTAGPVPMSRIDGSEHGATHRDPVGTASTAVATCDLSTPTEVHDLVIAFYREIALDELLEPVFGQVAEVDWAEHIPHLIDYWCRILFRSGPYAGSVTRTHRHLHDLAPIRPEHCDRWFALWTSCIGERWSGPHADHAERHAATLMQGLAKRVFGFDWTARTGTAAPPMEPGPSRPTGHRPAHPEIDPDEARSRRDGRPASR